MSQRGRQGRGRATADHVARVANVSRVAVSRAFNPHASIKPEKRDRILKIAQEMNYTPDVAARSLVTRRSHLVGVIVPDVCSPWESQEIDKLTTALQAEGFATLLFKTRTDRSMDDELLTYMKGYNPDSIIAFTENVGPEILGRMFDRAMPIYVTYPHAENETSGGMEAGLLPFDTLRDTRLPEADGLFIGGGFPETCMAELEANVALRSAVREAIEDGLPAYAECGGLMYLARSIRWMGRSARMAGVIPADAVMQPRPVGRGYVHLRDMSSQSLQNFYRDLDAQNSTRDGVVVDERNNFGGFVNAYALDVLSRRPYLNMTFRGFDQAEPARSILGQRALERPTVLITNRVTLSDGEDFSEGYRALGLGKIVGEPTAGWIIYTSAGRLIDGGTVRLPFITITDNHGQPMEGHPRPVDIPVSRALGESFQGKDSELDAAVRSLLGTVGGVGRS